MKISLVCEHGGHLTEMLYLLKSFEGNDIFFITNKSMRTESLPYRKYLIDHIGKNPLNFIYAFITMVIIFQHEKPDLIVSTGAEISIPAFIIGKVFFRIKTIYVECWCRVKTTSFSGRIVYPFSDLFLVQWPQLIGKYGKKAQYVGAVI